ncbi:uncharacterized protein LOC120849477 [Ixodes scapularis]|uniref:uncharacterized protein LOC120849477 n=1 Tax=Ixodes scapularis TaxID=6945 RepID=UPI001A9D2BB3|nr:uncharacterized protein LOC120849477 [Ixodes scapularis]
MIEKVPLQFKVGTGSQVNLLPLSLFRSANSRQHLIPSPAVLQSYNGSAIGHLGKARLTLKFQGKVVSAEFFVVKKNRRALLGLPTCEELGLVNRVHEIATITNTQSQVQREFPALFEGIGKIQRPYSISFKEGTVPVVQPTRRVPQALMESLKQELNRMEQAGIITRMKEPSDWEDSLRESCCMEENCEHNFLISHRTRGNLCARGNKTSLERR